MKKNKSRPYGRKPWAIITLLLLIIAIYNSYLQAQSCFGFSENNCELPIDWDYNISSQSINLEMYQGQSFRLNVILYSDQKYSIRFCPDNELGTIQYRIISDATELAKRSFEPGFESEMDHIEFVNTLTRKITIEVKVLKSNINIDLNDKHCLGITIGHKEEYSFMN